MRSKSSGFASILAMVFLAIGATLVVFIYSLLTESIAISSSQDRTLKASLAADSGLDYLNLRLGTITKREYIEGTSPPMMLTALQSYLQDHRSELSGSPAITAITTGLGGFSIGPVTVQTDGDAAAGIVGTSSFTTTVETLSSTFSPTPEFQVVITGSYARGGMTSTRTIGMRAKAVSMAHLSESGFPMLAKGNISLPTSRKGGVFLYDLLGYDADGNEVWGLNKFRKGEAYDIPGGGSVMTFGELEVPRSAALPTYSPTLYQKLNDFTWNGYTNPSAGATTTWRNVKIPKNTNLVVQGNVTIEGVLYMEYPSSITFDGNSTTQTLNIKGAIIWQPAPGAEASIRQQDLYFGRYLTVNTESQAIRDSYLSTVLGANATDTLLNGNMIVAPQTDMTADPGNDFIGIKNFNGGLHVRDLDSSGSGNVLDKAPETGAMVINLGTLMAEGDIDLGGNTAFCIKPPARSAVVVDVNRYRFAFDQLYYFEP